MTNARSIQAQLPQFCAALTLILAASSASARAQPRAHLDAQDDAQLPRAETTQRTAGVSMGADAEPQGEAPHYTCPMHPEVDSDTPGRCPHCGMKLEEKKAPELWGGP